MSDKLILKPDPIRDRLGILGTPLVIYGVVGLLIYAALNNFRFGFMFYLALGAVFYLHMFQLLRNLPQSGHLELRHDGIKIVQGQDLAFQNWRDLSRFTLLEKVSRDENDRLHPVAHYLTARLLGPEKADANAATNETDAQDFRQVPVPGSV